MKSGLLSSAKKVCYQGMPHGKARFHRMGNDIHRNSEKLAQTSLNLSKKWQIVVNTVFLYNKRWFINTHANAGSNKQT